MNRGVRIVEVASPFVWIWTIAGCGPPEIGPPPGPPPGARGTPMHRSPPMTPIAMPIPRPAAPDQSAMPEVVRANNALAVELYRALRARPGNLLIAPPCVTTGLAMLRAGARGETADEIDRALHRRGPLPDGGVAAMLGQVNADGPDATFQVRLASTAWLQQGYPIREDFHRALRATFAVAEDPLVDFVGHPDRAAALINDWIARRTGGKIDDVVSSESVRAPARMVLTSALYFRGQWVETFFEEATHDAPFHSSPASEITVRMMSLHSYIKTLSYADRGTYRVVSIPCGRGAFSMVIFLPDAIDGLDAMESALGAEGIEADLARLKRPDEIRLKLPRFRLRTSDDLIGALRSLGIARAFDRPRADFSGINSRRSDLFLSGVRSSTFIDVDEKGIEAAGVTWVVAADSFGDEVPEVVVDHPFLYAIRDDRSGILLFLGRVVDPGTDKSW